jgi:hypothetical protein
MVPHLFSPAEAMEKAYTVSKESSPLERPKPESVTEGTSDEGVGQAGTDASTKAPEEVASSSPKETGGAGRSPAAEPEELEFEGIIRIQGIEPSLDLPLEWVARNLCGPENFIHFIVISRRLAPQLPSRATDWLIVYINSLSWTLFFSACWLLSVGLRLPSSPEFGTNKLVRSGGV